MLTPPRPSSRSSQTLSLLTILSSSSLIWNVLLFPYQTIVFSFPNCHQLQLLLWSLPPITPPAFVHGQMPKCPQLRPILPGLSVRALGQHQGTVTRGHLSVGEVRITYLHFNFTQTFSLTAGVEIRSNCSPNKNILKKAAQAEEHASYCSHFTPVHLRSSSKNCEIVFI